MRSEQPTRIVVKVGTSTLTDSHGRIDRAFIADLTAQLAGQKSDGHEIVLVSSGAIRAGRERLASREGRHAPGNAGLQVSESSGVQADAGANAGSNTGIPEHRNTLREAQQLNTLPYKQAAAAIGQGLLIHTYTEAFGWRGVDCAQVLLTRDDLDNRHRFLNARNTLQALLSLGVVPIINENDTVAVEEIKFGDNDMLAALVATLVEADLLLILSDVEGLYANPSLGEATLIRQVTAFDDALTAPAGDSESGVGTGGMRTKVEAARVATSAGIRAVIARGRRERVITDVVSGAEVGTSFLPCTHRLPARKRWIAHGARPRGSVTVNSRAREKLIRSGVSLLAVGIVDVSGSFTSGDLIEVRDETGSAFARGLANYADTEIRRVLGLHSDEFEAALGYHSFDEIIHRDNLVLNGAR